MTTPKSCAQASLAMAACRAYVSSFDLAGKNLVPALRIFLEITKPPKEQQRLCRLLWAFSGAFYDQQTHGMWVSHEAVYLLVMSLVVLHTDAHSPVVKTKMKVSLFLPASPHPRDAMPWEQVARAVPA